MPTYNLDYKWETFSTFVANVQNSLDSAQNPTQTESAATLGSGTYQPPQPSAPATSTVVTFESGPAIKLNMAEVIYFHKYFNSDDRVQNYENRKLVVYLKSGGVVNVDNTTTSQFESKLIPNTP